MVSFENRLTYKARVNAFESSMSSLGLGYASYFCDEIYLGIVFFCGTTHLIFHVCELLWCC